MKKANEDFVKRKAEIEKYFDFLSTLDKDKPTIHFSEKGVNKISKVDDELLKILKANGFLLIYNLVESACRNSLWEILSAIQGKKLSYKKLTEEAQLLWIKQKVKDLRNAKDETLEKHIQSIATEVINNALVEFKKETEFIDLSGNIDAQKIRTLAEIYGFDSKVGDAKEKAGADLEEIKKKRNHLAHGRVTFAECGKDYSVTQMCEYKKNAISYLESILSNIETYIKGGKYQVPKKKKK